ncbi:MAG: DNA polymerase I [Syntrophobacteraceae bacterium]|jgi:DNA polymerase-1|nr:DNA polymerase I [Syntrophobacteraceae bacterium]
MKTLYLVDGSSYIYRAFYALGRFSSSRGLPTQAVYGFATMMAKVIREKKPDYLCVAFDAPGPTFRHERFESYKATRQSMPEDLAVQIPYIKRLVSLNGIPQLEMEGYEADDLIATLTRRSHGHGLEVIIVSGDKDLHQLIRDPWVSQWDPQRDRIFTESSVEEKLGVKPFQVRDYLALLGDSSDNIPGVKGVGEKTARQLIREWGSLEAVYDHLEDIPTPSLRKKLREGRESAFLSRELVTLDHDAPVTVDVAELEPAAADLAHLRELYEELEFKSLLEALPEESEAGRIARGRPEAEAPEAMRSQAFRLVPCQKLLDAASGTAGPDPCSVRTTAVDGSPMRAELQGVAVATTTGEVAYWRTADGIRSTSEAIGPQLDSALLGFLSNPRIPKAGEDLKAAWIHLRRQGWSLEGIAFDTRVAGYLLDPGAQSYGVDRLAGEHLRTTSTGPAPAGAEGAPGPASPEEACRLATLAGQLVSPLRKSLQEAHLLELFESVEMPLVSILAEMEHHGVLLDGARIEQLARHFQEEMDRKKAVIYDLAKEEFNIQSPRQLAAILFDKLGLRVVKKTKSGPSTDMSVLEELALEHPLPEQILVYRSLAKLKGTYADTLPGLIHPETGRIHTSFNQTATATGRLSSSDPNLQNIPVRSDEGVKIRAAFVAPPGCRLLSADYSQIELRILAHYSRDPHLTEAFEADADVHRHTAAEMLNITPLEVTPEMRRQAKMINFGIIYGMSAFGLAQRLRITPRMARTAIERYFERYSGVRNYIDETVARARSLGYCQTLLGRRRFIPELKSRNRNVQQQGERLAVNTPIQGTAADLIKKAMIDVSRALKDEKLRTAMILQVHDELVFEVPDDELERIKELVRERMEAVWPLSVPLRVDVGWGRNWAEAHP